MIAVYLYKENEAMDRSAQHKKAHSILDDVLSRAKNINLTCSSISHSGRYVAVALSDKPVGVDVEMMRESMPLRLEEKILSEEEKRFVKANLKLRDHWLLRLWTLKESYGKAHRFGIAYEMTDYTFIPSGDSCENGFIRVKCSDKEAVCFNAWLEDASLSVCVIGEETGAPQLLHTL